jgi:ketosteroid isomerase-like protein
MRLTAASLCCVVLACARAETPRGDAPDLAGVDSLNARIVDAYRKHDPQAYAAAFTDSAVFEWPAFDTVRGATALGAMARSNWAALRDMDLRLTVADRRVAPGQVTEFGAFQQTYSDSAGARMTEYGRYAAVLVRQGDGAWKMDRFFGFADSTRRAR